MYGIKMKKYIGILIIYLLFHPAYSFAISTEELIKAALERTKYQVSYDGSYHSIKYPGGDVPGNIGVCTD
jgi:uncharacterized protein YijF (DUF1287 family)